MSVVYKNGGGSYPFDMEQFSDIFATIRTHQTKEVYTMSARKNRFSFDRGSSRQKLLILIDATPSEAMGMSTLSTIKHGEKVIEFDKPLRA